MDILNQILAFLQQIVAFAPFLAALGTFSIVGRLANKEIFSKEKAQKPGKYQKFYFEMRRSLPLLPVIAGFITGCFDKAHGIAYYMVAGILSVFLFDLVQRYTGYTIDLPGESINPPEN